MNDFSKMKEQFSYILNSRRMPHAVLIEGADAKKRREVADFLSKGAVCSGDFRPCEICKNCIKAKANSHPDIYTPKLSGKTNIINVESVRELIKDSSIIPNEADTKVFVLYDVDKCMPEISQNAFLKVLEEPPQSTLFILTAENSKKMLSTILSRVQVFSLDNKNEIDEEVDALAQEVVEGILALSEDKLLFATAKLNNRVLFKEVLKRVCEYLRQGLSYSVGVKNESDIAYSIAKKLTKQRIIGLIELSSKAILKADRNVNMALLCTWLCGEYRRISWQR
ncbi:MAG: hypothetical protein IJO20_02470 [Ruminococcus sp.]|nr:hypothetical protein [Ruminococcus sp.]MBQ7133336.1 hypothetical protein [Ruminococcus sp.]